MSIATYTEVRRALIAAADVLGHPTKGAYTAGKINVGKPHRYGAEDGTVVYREGGQVGGRFDGRYLVARGSDHESSAFGLARALGVQIERRKETDTVVVVPDLGVQVDEVDAGHFWLFCLPEGYTLPEG